MVEGLLTVQWLRLCASTAGRTGLIPCWGTKISPASQRGQKRKKKVVVVGVNFFPGGRGLFCFVHVDIWLFQHSLFIYINLESSSCYSLLALEILCMCVDSTGLFYVYSNVIFK